jgi:hypothetical protein
VFSGVIHFSIRAKHSREQKGSIGRNYIAILDSRSTVPNTARDPEFHMDCASRVYEIRMVAAKGCGASVKPTGRGANRYRKHA